MVVLILPFKQGVCQSLKDLELSFSLIPKKNKNLEFLKKLETNNLAQYRL